MASIGEINSNPIIKSDASQREEVKILYEINLLLKSRTLSKNDGGEGLLYFDYLFNSITNNPIVEYKDIEIEQYIIKPRNIKTNEILFLRNINKNIEREYVKFKNYVHSSQISSKIILRINIPIQTDFALTADTFALGLIKKIVDDKSLQDKIDLKLSGYEQFEIESLQNESNEEVSKVTDLDARIAAIFSHYIYFYLDYLELQTLHRRYFDKMFANGNDILIGNLTYFINNIDNKKHEIQFDDFNPQRKHTFNWFNTSILQWGGADKITFRIFNRLHEIFSIVIKGIKLDHRKIKLFEDNVLPRFKSQIKQIELKLIYNAFILSKEIPMDFYELYDLFRYWDYVKEYVNNGNELTTECHKWHIVYPANNNYLKNGTTITPANKNNFIEINSIPIHNENEKNSHSKERVYRCSSEVIHYGKYNGISGYGGGLLAKIEDDKVTKFVYSTKGTDVNSANDWIAADILQGLTGLSLQHFQTVRNAIEIDKEVRKYEKSLSPTNEIVLYFCGHSLGGGLASSNALATGREAITFNAAGLNFIGGLWTRLSNAIINLNYKESISPLSIANKVHPIRIDGELIDIIMLISKPLTINLNQRGYGRYSLVLHNVDLPSGAKHGINNFLNNNLMNELRICKSASGIRKITHATVKSSNQGINTTSQTKSLEGKEKETSNTLRLRMSSLESISLKSVGIIYLKSQVNHR